MPPFALDAPVAGTCCQGVMATGRGAAALRCRGSRGAPVFDRGGVDGTGQDTDLVELAFQATSVTARDREVYAGSVGKFGISRASLRGCLAGRH